MTQSTPTDRAYLTVIQWPDGWSEEVCGRLLEQATGMDLYQATLVAKRGAPGVVAILEPQAAAEAEQVLRSRGVMVFTPLRSQMLEIPEAISVKRLWWTQVGQSHALGYERWRGQPQEGVFDPAHMFLIVRARLNSSERRVQTDRNAGTNGAMVGFMVGGFGGAVVGGMISSGGSSVSSSVSTKLTESMDIYTRAPSGLVSCFRISSSRFDASILGDQRGVSPAENMPKITEILLRANPRVILDQDFESFRTPPDIVRGHYVGTKSGSVTRTSEQGPFEFYSQWSYLLYRSMMS
jgi:hypothetical protein